MKGSDNSITGFFYNPNIHPAEEFEKRHNALIAYSKKANFDIVFGDYEPDKFFKEIGATTETPVRCSICWRLRLKKTAEYARDKKYDAFTTTLLVSPYQNQEEIIKIGLECGKAAGINFIESDFRSGFRQAQDEAKEHGIYRQRYCGCVFSEKEMRIKKCRT